jgi:hypothetical protein
MYLLPYRMTKRHLLGQKYFAETAFAKQFHDAIAWVSGLGTPTG